MSSEIYIELLDEGTPTWRPTQAVDRGNGVYLVLPTTDYDEEDEKWAFPPGSLVMCEMVIDDGEETLVARHLVSENRESTPSTLRELTSKGRCAVDPQLYGAQPWSDSVLQSLYDAIHAVAVTGAGATSLVHEAKVDIVTVPNLSEHLSHAATAVYAGADPVAGRDDGTLVHS